MKTSQIGIMLISHYEGYRDHVYVCPAGKPTIGYGHVVLPGEHFDAITIAEAEVLLAGDLAIAEAAVNRASVPLRQCEFDALVSFVFNVGTGAFENSTLRRLLLRGNRQGVAGEFLRWNKSGDQVLAGLTARRQAEMQLFLGER